MSFVVPLVLGLVLILLSILIRKDDYRGLISGYQDLSPAEEAEYGSLIAKDTSKILYVVGIISITLGISLFLKIPSFVIVLLANAIVIFTIYSLLRKRKYSGVNKNNIHRWVGAAFILALILLNISGYYSTSAATLVISDRTFKITGMYAIEDKLSNIRSVELVNERPRIRRKLNGFSFGEFQKGRFRIGEDVSAYLNLVSNGPPFLYIESSSVGGIYLNGNSPEITKSYYNNLLKQLQRD